MEDLKPIGRGVSQMVGWCVEQGVRFEPEGATNAAGSAVARGEDVDIGIADHDGFSGRDGMAGQGRGFVNKSFEAVGCGFFGVKAVAAIVLEEKS